MTWPEEFGARLREAMTRRRTSNITLAREMGVHAITVSKWRSGAYTIEDHRIPALAAYLRVSEEWLRSGAGPMERAAAVAEPVAAYTPRHARNLPLSVREYLLELRTRLTRADVPDDAIDEAIELLRSPAVFSFFVGGAAREFTESDVLANVRTFAEESIIPTLRRRGYTV